MNKLLHKTIQKKGLWILVGLLALGQLGRVTLLPDIRLYPHDIFITLWCISLLLTNREKVMSAVTDLSKKILAFNFFIPVLLILSSAFLLAQLQQPALLPLLYLLRTLFYGIFVYLLATTTSLTKKDFEQALISLGLISVVLGFLQLILIPDTRFLFILGFDDHYYRMIGTQLDPAFLGALLLISAFVTWHSTFLAKHSLVKTGCIVLFSLGILLTFSRATYLGYALTALALTAHSKKIRQSILKNKLGSGLVTIGIITVVFMARSTGGEGTNLLRTATITARIASVKEHLPRTRKEWIIGKGLFYSTVQNTTSTSGILEVPNQAKVNNSLLFFILESSGILGLAAWIYALLKGMQVLVLQGEKTLVYFIGILLLLSCFNNTAFQPFVLLTSLLGFAEVVREYR